MGCDQRSRRGRLALGLVLGGFLLVSGSCASRERKAGPSAFPAPEAEPVQWENDWSHGCVFYEIFVRSFCDSDGDGIGDLPGLISKLDYLNDGDPAVGDDLGVGAIWLMPVFESPSYHGYDTIDYTKINPDYGTEEDFARLIAEAHRRGIRIILDFVLNHVSSRSPWFVAGSSPGSPYRGWFVWRHDNPGWTQPWGGVNPTWHQGDGGYYYGVFWGGMPDLNFRNSKVRRRMEELAVLWLDRGADGFRLDAVRHLIEDGPGQEQVDTPETHAYLKEFSAAVRRDKPRAVLVGEAWADTRIIASYYGSTAVIREGDELPMNFDFPLAAAIVAGVREGKASGIAAVLDSVRADYPPGVTDAPFLTNHDMVRLATQLGGDRAKLRLAASILLTLPGAPFLYYGEEAGLQNGPAPGDEAKRTPMPWNGSPGGGFTSAAPWHPFAPGKDSSNVAAETADPASLFHHYRALIRLRNSSPALRSNALELLSGRGQEAGILAWLRRGGGEDLLVIHNLSPLEGTAGPLPLPADSLESVFADGSPRAHRQGSEGWSVAMPAHSTGVWRLQRVGR